MDTQKLISQMSYILTQADLSVPSGFYAARAELISLLGQAETAMFGEPEFIEITAEDIVVEAVDETTGRLVRRELPLSFRENDNALRLLGETSNGIPTEITFLSGSALDKIKDLIGRGPDRPRCGDEEEQK